MTERDEIDVLAGEFVLGTLDAAERAALAARRLHDRELDAAINAWERRLAPLAQAPSVAPSTDLLPRIHARIDTPSRKLGDSAQIIDLTGRLKFWKRTAAATSALAASLLAIFGAQQFAPPAPKSRNLVAVLQKDAQSPAFLVAVDVEKKLMTVRPVAAKREAGKSHELWLIHDSLGKPRSLGLIDDQASISPARLAAYDHTVIETATLAVSLEPEGGSPTGDPTGPVLFAGKMIDGAF